MKKMTLVTFVFLLAGCFSATETVDYITYSRFLTLVEEKRVQGTPEVPLAIFPDKIEGFYVAGPNTEARRFRVSIAGELRASIANRLQEQGVTVEFVGS